MRARAAVLHGPRKIILEEFPLPEIGPDEGLLKVEMAGVCGSDPAWWSGRVPLPAYPTILGHEIVGRIARIGREAAREYGVKEGDRVVVESSLRCLSCEYCQAGKYHLCDNRRGYGNVVPTTVAPSLWGAFSEYLYIAPHSQIHKMAESTPPEAGVLVCAVIANGIRWVREFGGVGVGDAVVVQGAGPQGLASVIAARQLGASPIIVTGLGRDAHRLQVAKRFGADLAVNVEQEDVLDVLLRVNGGMLADVVMNMHGAPDVIATALRLVRKGGTIVQAGLGHGGVPTGFDMNSLILREIRLQGVFTHLRGAVRQALAMVERGELPFSDLVTHRWTLDETELAIRSVGGEVDCPGLIKGVIIP